MRPTSEEDFGEYFMHIVYQEIDSLEFYKIERTVYIALTPDTASDAEISDEFAEFAA